MNISDIDLNLLNVFSVVYREQSVSKAAEALGLSQPATSNALSRLRLLLDDPLFVRHSRGMTPTPRAHEISDSVEKALAILQSCLTKTTEFDFTKEERTFRVAMSDYTELLIMPKVIEWITESAPNIKIVVSPVDGGDVQKDLNEGKLDLALGNIPFLQNSFRVQRLFLEEFVVIAKRGHVLNKNSITTEEFISHPHIAFSARSPRGTHIDQALRKEGLSRKVTLQVPNFVTIPALVARTDHIAYVPLRLAQIFMDIYPIKIMRLPIALKDVSINQFWHETLHADPAHAWLRGLLFDVGQRI